MNFENMTNKELKALAKEKQIKNWWTMKKSELIKAISNVVVTGETKVPEDYEATVIDNTIVTVSKTIDLDGVAQNEPQNEEETFVGTLFHEEESAPESEPEASENDVEDEAVQNNDWEEIATKKIASAYDWIVGQNENVLQDYEEDSKQYKDSYDYLYSGDEIMNDIYHSAISTKYDDGYCGGKAQKEMRFAGKNFCMNLIRELLKKDGYLKEEKKKKLLVASVRNIEINEFEVVHGEYANRNEFYAALREQGYRVRYVSTEENFERDGEKYKKACDKVKADRKAARAAKKMEAKK